MNIWLSGTLKFCAWPLHRTNEWNGFTLKKMITARTTSHLQKENWSICCCGATTLMYFAIKMRQVDYGKCHMVTAGVWSCFVLSLWKGIENMHLLYINAICCLSCAAKEGTCFCFLSLFRIRWQYSLLFLLWTKTKRSTNKWVVERL